MPETNLPTILFHDPRLRMTALGRALVRIVSSLFVLLFIAAGIAFVASDVAGLKSFGIFFLLGLLNKLFHRDRGDSRLSHLLGGASINAASVMRPSSLKIIERAYDKSFLHRSSFALELLAELLRGKEIQEAMLRLDVSPKEFRVKLEDMLDQRVSAEGAELDTMVLQIASRAVASALGGGREYIDVYDLFSGVMSSDDALVRRLVSSFSFDPKDVDLAIIFGEATRHSFGGMVGSALGSIMLERHKTERHRIMNRAWTARPTPTLDTYAHDLTDEARGGSIGFMIGHEAEYNHLAETLARPINPNALLVGEVGSGKETVIAHLARAITKDLSPKGIFDRRVVSLDLTPLVAGASPEELQARLQKIVKEIELAGNIILVIPDIHNLMKTSGTAYLSAADALMPIIMQNAFPVVGTTYPREFAQFIEPRSDFVGVFEVMHIEEISAEDARRLLVYEAMLLEKQFKVTISLGAVSASVRLAKKYFHTKLLPSSAEELLKSALTLAEQRGERVVSQETVVATAEEKVNIPMHEADKGEAETLLNLEDIIHERFIDQEEAVKVVAQSLREYRSGLARPGGPIASFLFVGPTGVGKTELAKILAKIQFGSEAAMVRFDMTEYQDKANYSRFIGSADGSVQGALTEAIHNRPYCLILLDEFEKAYPDILNLFLQVLDDGRLTSGIGQTVDFQNTIIIATSNARSDIINEALRGGQSMTSISEYLKQKLVDVFKPELLNRFAKIVVFKNLSMGDIEKVTVLNLKSLIETLAGQGISIVFDPEAVRLLAKAGFDPAFGARPIRRAIEDRVRAVLAEKILKQEIGHGARVRVSAQGDELQFINQV